MALTAECYVCQDEILLREAKGAGWTEVVHDDVRHYCSKDGCQAAAEKRRKEVPAGEAQLTSAGELSAEQLNQIRKRAEQND